jgi:hypothetical protein
MTTNRKYQFIDPRPYLSLLEKRGYDVTLIEAAIGYELDDYNLCPLAAKWTRKVKEASENPSQTENLLEDLVRSIDFRYAPFGRA